MVFIIYYCAFDKLNPIVKDDGTIWHACEHYGTYLCENCDSRYDGEKVKQYMENNPKEHT